MLVAVIDLAVGVAGDGHGDLVGQRGDGQRALLIGDGVVGGDIAAAAHQLRIARDVLARADVRLAASQGHARDGVALGGRRAVKLAASERRAVVGLAIRARSDGQCHRVNLQPAVCHGELNVREIVADVLKLRRGQAHRIGARVGTLRDGLTGEGEVLRLVERIADRRLVPDHGLLRAVISHGVRVAGDGHGDLVGHRGDGQRTGPILDGIVRGDVPIAAHQLRIARGVLARAGVRLAARHGDARKGIARGGVGAGGIAVLRQRGTVVDLAVGARGDGQRHGRDLQLAVFSLDVIDVVHIRRAVHDGNAHDLVYGGRGFHIGDGALDLHGQDIAVGELLRLTRRQIIGLAAKFDGIAAVGQGRAVIGPGRAVGGNNDLLRGGPAHGQLTVCGRDAVVRGLTRGKLVALHLVHNGRRRRISDLADDRHCDGVVPDKAGNLRLRQGVRLAVVGEVRALRGDGHGARGDGQRAVVHDELNVREVRVVILELLRF